MTFKPLWQRYRELQPMGIGGWAIMSSQRPHRAQHPNSPQETRQVQYTHTQSYSPKRLLSRTGETTHVSLQFIILTGQALQTNRSCARSTDMKHGQALASRRLSVLRWQGCKTGIKSLQFAASINSHGISTIRCNAVISVLKGTE